MNAYTLGVFAVAVVAGLVVFAGAWLAGNLIASLREPKRADRTPELTAYVEDVDRAAHRARAAFDRLDLQDARRALWAMQDASIQLARQTRVELADLDARTAGADEGPF